ncbi:MAG: hypothetical protein QF464_17280, partial [Myxococcota bacterium]|nr:hypothetical protein [Myxococcota bacterium]
MWWSDQIAAIDDESGALSRPGSPGAHTLIIVVMAILMVGCIEMGVKHDDVRVWAAQGLMDLFDLRDGVGARLARQRLRLMGSLSWAAGTVFFYLVVPALVVRLVFRRPLSDFGMTLRGAGAHTGLYLTLFLPVAALVVLMSFDPAFLAKYPFYHRPESLFALLVWEL